MPRFLTPIDLTGLEIRNVSLHNLATAPASPKVGQTYYDTALGYQRTFDGTGWQRGSYLNDPYARANHTGSQAAATISDFNVAVQANRLDQLAAPTAAVGLNGQRLTAVAAGTADTDAVNFRQLLDLGQNKDWKESVRVAATGNLVLSGAQTVDGVALVADQNIRVLAGLQTNAAERGIYTVATGAWPRSTDFNSNANVTPGIVIPVEEGTTNGGKLAMLTTPGPIALGTTALTFILGAIGGAGGEIIVAGAGLTKTGSTVDIGGGLGLVVTADAIAIDTAVVTRKGGATTIGDGTATAFTITHNLGTRDVTVGLYEAAGAFAEFTADVKHATLNTVIIEFAVAPAVGAYRVVVQG